MKKYILVFAITLGLFINPNFAGASTGSKLPDTVYRLESWNVKNASIILPDKRTVDLMSPDVYALDFVKDGVDVYGANLDNGYFEIRLDTSKHFIITYSNNNGVLSSLNIKRENHAKNDKSGNWTYDQLIKYQDLNLMPSSKVRVETSSKGVGKVMYDKENDGHFEKTLKPDIVVKGPKADDANPPEVSVKEMKTGANSTVTLIAKDENGVGRIYYFLSDDGNKSPYGFYSVTKISKDKAVIKNLPTGKYIYYLAEDRIGNRGVAGFRKYQVTGTDTNP